MKANYSVNSLSKKNTIKSPKKKRTQIQIYNKLSTIAELAEKRVPFLHNFSFHLNKSQSLYQTGD
jgi:ABC-type polysaccharide/polyol phosphate transport system ATPase subunit